MGARASREGAPRDDGALDDDGFVTVRATRRDATRAISHSHSFAFDAFRARVSRVSRARLTPRARRVAGGIARRRRARARRPRRRASRRGRRHRRARGRAAVLRRPRGRRDARARRRARRRGRRARREQRERSGARRERPPIAPCERTNERTNERKNEKTNERHGAVRTMTRAPVPCDACAHGVARLYCAADDAKLCLRCDRTVRGARTRTRFSTRRRKAGEGTLRGNDARRARARDEHARGGGISVPRILCPRRDASRRSTTRVRGIARRRSSRRRSLRMRELSTTDDDDDDAMDARAGAQRE